jgi:hypothetical protein
MTTPPEAPAQASAESPVRTKLAAAAARAGARKATPRRRTAAKKTTTPTVSRNERAAKRGKYADRIAPAVKSGAALLGWRNPVAGRVIELRADAWAASLDRVAAEDPRVDALLAKISGIFGKSGAWGGFMKENALMVGGVMVATGRAPLTGPPGMILAMFAGALVEQATMAVARDNADREWVAGGGEDGGAPDSWVAHHVGLLLQERQEKAAARTAPVVEEDQGAEPAPEPVGHYEGNTYQRDGSTVFAREGW